jgi:hypothetical protein
VSNPDPYNEKQPLPFEGGEEEKEPETPNTSPIEEEDDEEECDNTETTVKAVEPDPTTKAPIKEPPTKRPPTISKYF